MLKENGKISMGRLFSLISFVIIIITCISHIILSFYGKSVIVPDELVYVFLVTMGYTSNSKIQQRIKEKEDAIHRVI